MTEGSEVSDLPVSERWHTTSTGHKPMSFKLITNDNAMRRILLHTADDSTRYVTVEKIEHDAIGTPQWCKDEDSREDNLSSDVVLALIPPVLVGTAPAVIGTCEADGATWRTSVTFDVTADRTALYLTTERLETDCAGAPRWQHVRNQLLQRGASRIDADIVLACLR